MKKEEEIRVRGDRLKLRLVDMNKSLEDIAPDVGVDFSTLYRWMEGQAPKLPGAIALALRVQLPLGFLLGLEEDPDYKALIDLEFARLYGRAALVLAQDAKRQEEQEKTGLRVEQAQSRLSEWEAFVGQRRTPTSPDQTPDSQPPSSEPPESKPTPPSKREK